MSARLAGVPDSTALPPRPPSMRTPTPTGRQPTLMTALPMRDGPRNQRRWLATRPACRDARRNGTLGAQSGVASHGCTDTKAGHTLNSHRRRTGARPRHCLGTTPEPPRRPSTDFPTRQLGIDLLVGRRLGKSTASEGARRSWPAVDLTLHANGQSASRLRAPPLLGSRSLRGSYVRPTSGIKLRARKSRQDLDAWNHRCLARSETRQRGRTSKLGCPSASMS